jgi:hypothetical protein
VSIRYADDLVLGLQQRADAMRFLKEFKERQARFNTFDIHGDAQIPASAETKDPMGFGDHVILLHLDGRVSWVLHMQPNNVAVKNGDRAKAGQLLGRVGLSDEFAVSGGGASPRE